jgi:hypothetical protein
LGDDRIDGFDDLFEPFELEDRPPGDAPTRTKKGDPGSAGREVPQVRQPVPCPSCGSANPPFNRHCEACGARLSQTPLPVAPQPMLRTTAGARALMVLAGVIFTVAILALAYNVFRSDPEEAAETTTTTTTLVPPVGVVELSPVRAECTTDLPSFPCTALVDDDPSNSWNALDGGIGDEIVFLFSPAVQITDMFIYNLDDTERFLRNARIRGYEITIDDLQQAIVGEFEDTAEPQKIEIRSLRTNRLTLTITSSYAGIIYEGREPFRELALQEVTFFGREVPDAGG